MTFVLPEELAHTLLFLLLGTAAWVGLTVVLLGSPLATGALRVGRAAIAHSSMTSGLTVALVLCGSLVVGLGVLGGAAITDDEHTYRFIAHKLRAGALTAPSPVTELENSLTARSMQYTPPKPACLMSSSSLHSSSAPSICRSCQVQKIGKVVFAPG